MAALRTETDAAVVCATITGAGGNPIALDEFISRELDAHEAYEGEPGPRTGVQVFPAPRTLTLPGESPIRVVALQWHGALHSDTVTVDSGIGSGGLVAELALASVGGEVRRSGRFGGEIDDQYPRFACT